MEDPIMLSGNCGIKRIDIPVFKEGENTFISVSEQDSIVTYQSYTEMTEEEADKLVDDFLDKMMDETNLNILKVYLMNGSTQECNKNKISVNELEAAKLAVAELRRECNYKPGLTWSDLLEIGSERADDKSVSAGDCRVDDCAKCGIRDKCYRYNH